MATTGIDFIVQVNTGSEAVPVWTTVGCQRGGTLNRTTDVVDTTCKDSENWETNIGSIRHWSIDFDGLLVETDAGFTYLENAYNNNTQVHVQLVTAGGNMYSGNATLTDFSSDFPYDGEVTYTGTLQGSGPLTKS